MPQGRVYEVARELVAQGFYDNEPDAIRAALELLALAPLVSDDELPGPLAHTA